jgi:hypothetical protein
VRAVVLVLLLAAAASADLTSDIKRAFKRDEAEQRIVGLKGVHVSPDADRRERNRAAAAIEKALKREASPPVRMAALDLLLRLGTERALDRVIVGVLDREESVREHIHAIVRLRAHPGLRDAIVRAMKEDASWRFRASMVDLLLVGRREWSRRPLMDALQDAHPGVVSRAAEALYRLTGKPYGADREKWLAYFREEERKLARQSPDERRTYAGGRRKVELKEGPVRGLYPSLYTIPILRKRVVFVVDMSNSMHKVSRSSHFLELKRALFGLPSDVRFNILCFDQRMFFFTGTSRAKDLVDATTANKALCERWLNDLPAGEKTDVNRSVAAGLAMLKEALARHPQSRAELFILTDGRETARTTSLKAVEAQYRKLPVNRCQVHVISLGRQGTPALRVIAESSGGHFVEAPGR